MRMCIKIDENTVNLHITRLQHYLNLSTGNGPWSTCCTSRRTQTLEEAILYDNASPHSTPQYFPPLAAFSSNFLFASTNLMFSSYSFRKGDLSLLAFSDCVSAAPEDCKGVLATFADAAA